MIIHSRLKEYEVKIEDNIDFLNNIVRTENAEFVIDKRVYELYQEYLSEIPSSRLFIVEAKEENKIIETALDICEEMTEIPAKRNANLISIGGGIIQDITGFVANILYRGINWIFIPTTLLASADSCIGGKTSLNYKKYKNLLGTFYPPDVLYICPKFFSTLSEKDFQSGLGEVIKFNIMAGELGLQNIESNIDKLLRRDDSCLAEFVVSSLEYKKRFIEIDEFDKGERIKLNFAHTFGHAIETVSNYEIPHGTAVAIGMIMANKISCNRGILNPEIMIRSEKVLLKVINIDFSLDNISIEDFVRAMRKDKKQTSNQLTAVLMTNTTNELRIVKDITIDEVSTSLKYFSELYKSV